MRYCQTQIFQSTLPVGEATLEALIGQPYTKISIHASRGGSDRFVQIKGHTRKYFNPRFPWGKRPLRTDKRAHPQIFQSTLPVGEATCRTARRTSTTRYFNPRFPWGKRPAVGRRGISNFRISIHASRGGSDLLRLSRMNLPTDFNPRFPWGKRRGSNLMDATMSQFQSTLPVGEATGIDSG